jgi:hypothetical protein
MNILKPHVSLNVSNIETYAVQDKVWIEDPDGNAWEVFVVKGDAPAMNCAASPCCVPEAVTTASAAVSCCAPKLRHGG